MATGTGKTFTPFQIVWKLKKSGWLRKPVLFIADRKVLRDQAYNTFAPFVDSQSDPRNVIGGGRFNDRCWSVRELLSYHVPSPRWTPSKHRGRPSHALKHLMERWGGNHG